MNNKIKILEILMLIFTLALTPIAMGFPTEKLACNGCHAYPPKLLNISTDMTETEIVNVGEEFTVNIDWSGGANDGQTQTAVKWPTDFSNIGIERDNSLFNITPILPELGTNASGSTSSTLTAPTKPGNYTVRVYVSTGNWNEIPTHETNFADINVTVLPNETTTIANLTTIEISPTSKTLDVNGTQSFEATALDQNNVPIEGIDISWTVENIDVGEINPVASITNANGTSTAIFNASANGSTMITAMNGTIIGTANVSVGVPMPPSKKGKNWSVKVGGESSDMSIQGLRYYPGIITINEGDSITWTFNTHEWHTVSFLTGQPPMPGSPESLSAMGGTTFDGTENISSGIMNDGAKYTLTFDKSGTFQYLCLIHPGMAGVVIVNPAGTPYPTNQGKYDKIGNQEFTIDLSRGQTLMDNVNVENIATDLSGNKITRTNIDIPIKTNTTVRLKPENNSGVSGTAKLEFVSPGQLQVSVELKGMGPENINSVDIRLGNSKFGGPILFTLNDVQAGTDGTGNSTTMIEGPPWFAIPSKGWFIETHRQGQEQPLASGNIVKHYVAALRFLPNTITINEGDTVEWKQLNGMMIHTVSFLATGQEPPEFIINDTINPEAVMATGGNVHNGAGSGFINSGILEPGDTYDLTFNVPGTYKYLCLIHDEMKMTGTIKVLPTSGTITGMVINDLNGNGRIDVNETGLQGWTINLLGIINETQVVTNQTTTDDNGAYMFNELPLGKYFISEELQTGFVPITNPAITTNIDMPKVSKKNFFNKPIVEMEGNLTGGGS